LLRNFLPDEGFSDQNPRTSKFTFPAVWLEKILDRILVEKYTLQRG
jgi:hypothetical protein